MSQSANTFEKSVRRDAALLDKAVAIYFEPVVKRHGLMIVKIADGVYEIPSPFFIQRIECYAGHGGRGFSAMLRQTSLPAFRERDPDVQLDLTWFMRFNGESIDSFQFLIESDDAFLKLAQSYSEAIDRFGVLYLLGLKDDFAAVIGKMKKESEARSERIGKMMREIMKNSKFVRAEWPVVVPHIPGQESETVIFLDAKAIHFLGDLEGAREEAFKKQTASLFHQCGNVKVAYLARLFGQNVPTTAALCLVTKPNFEKTMIQAVGKIFAELFDLQESFNVVFLNSDQDADLAKVCKPFYAV